MNKISRVLAAAVGIILFSAAILADQSTVTTSTSCGWGEFVSPHELRGIKLIRLDVDGLPNPVEGTDITEATLAAQLREQISHAGLAVAAGYVPEAPRLHIRVLPVLGDSQHFFVITAEIEEPCRVSRAGGIDVPFCTTWSIYPRMGLFARGQPSALVGQVADVGTQFLRAWSYDNRSNEK